MISETIADGLHSDPLPSGHLIRDRSRARRPNPDAYGSDLVRFSLHQLMQRAAFFNASGVAGSLTRVARAVRIVI